MTEMIPDDEAGREGEEGEIENDVKQTLAAHVTFCLLDQQVIRWMMLFFGFFFLPSLNQLLKPQG